jgi:Family of unknown function (DUF6113)
MTGLRIGSGLLVGLVTGVAGVVVSRHEVVVAGVAWPWGLVVTLVAVPLVLAGVGRVRSEVSGWAAAVGWFVPVVVLVLVHPGGDQIPGQDTVGLAYLILGLIVVVATVLMTTTPQPLRPAGAPARPPGSGSRRTAPPRRH